MKLLISEFIKKKILKLKKLTKKGSLFKLNINTSEDSDEWDS